jgi:hypothetical protein
MVVQMIPRQVGPVRIEDFGGNLGRDKPEQSFKDIVARLGHATLGQGCRLLSRRHAYAPHRYS